MTSNDLSDRTTQAIGWLLVAIQFVLILLLILLPSRSDWPVNSMLQLAGDALGIIGLLAAAVAAIGLGTSLTPTPVPKKSGQLRTSGLYNYVRHPIYSALLCFVVGSVVRSGSGPKLAVGLATVAFFYSKAKWEEQHLRRKYPNYEEYASRTPMFFPLRKQRIKRP